MNIVLSATREGHAPECLGPRTAEEAFNSTQEDAAYYYDYYEYIYKLLAAYYYPAYELELVLEYYLYK